MVSIDNEKYAQLLAASRPAVIESPEEHERILTIAEALMDRGEALTAEERKLLELLVLLVEVFERQVEDDVEDELPLPHETLQRMMQARGWGTDALNDIFGSPAAVNEVLSGTRAISKGQAKALAKLFQTPAKLFMAG